MSNLFKPITPDITELKTGTPIIKQGDRYIVAGIGGDFIPGGSSGGIDTSDATATAADILSPKTAYVDGKLITGEMINNGSISERLEVGNTLTLDSGYYESISISATFSGKELIVTPTDDVQTFKDVYYRVTVNPIPQEYIITSDANATSNDLVYGKSAYVNGAKVEGSLLPLFVRDEQGKYRIDPGYTHEEIVLNKTDTGDATAQPSDVAPGKIFYNAAGRQEGTMPSSTPYRDINVVVIPSGVITEETEIVVGNIRQGETVLPTASNQTVANANDFVVGSIVVEGDSNLKPENIVEGISIFGIVGTAPKDEVIASSGATVNANVVTVGKGYLSEDLTVTIPMGRVLVGSDDLDDNVMVNGNYSNEVTITEGYHNDRTVTIGNAVTGYTITPSVNAQIIVPGTYITGSPLLVEGDANLVPENIKKGVSIFGVPGENEAGFELVKVTNYHPARDGFTAPQTVTFSGLGTVESEWGGDPVDFSDVNGDYVVTEETKFRKGLARIYKQQGGKYYLCGYDPSDMDWSEYEAHWYVSETVGGYGYSAKMSCYSSAEIPNGTVNWSNENIGTFPVTTTITNETISSLTETSLAQSVTAFDTDTAEWTEGSAVDISSYSITPQTNGIYFVQDGKLIGQLIDRELHIPKDGLVRRFKAVDGHFVDDIWGTEMMPYGDISYDELGFHGNNPAPMAHKGSCLSASNTFNFGEKTTMNVFFKPHEIEGNALIFGFGAKWSSSSDRCVILNSGFGFRGYWNYGIATPILGKWNMYTLSIELIAENKCKTRFYANGKFIAEKDYNTALPNGNGENNEIGIFSRSAIGGGAEYISGQIDEACVWNRILSDEEIAGMAKGLEGFGWDIPEKPYVQEQPVLYLSGANGRSAESGQLLLGDEESGGKFSDGAIYSYSGDTVYPNMYIPTSSELFGSGDFSLCLDVMPIISRNSAAPCPVFNSGSNNPGFFLKQIDGKGEYHPGYYAGTELVCTSESVPLSEWTYIIITCGKGTLRMYKKGVLCMSQSITGSHLPITSNLISLFREAGYSYGFKGAIRNVRLYNRAITDDEVAELS